MKTIKKIFKDTKPSVVLLEGLPADETPSPAWYVEYAKACEKRNYDEVCGEPDYAAYFVNENGIPLLSGEITDLEITRRLRAEGVSAEDVVGFYTARILPQYFREDPAFGKSEAVFQSKIELDLKWSRKTLQTGAQFGYPEFIAWLIKHTDSPISEFVTANPCAPVTETHRGLSDGLR